MYMKFSLSTKVHKQGVCLGFAWSQCMPCDGTRVLYLCKSRWVCIWKFRIHSKISYVYANFIADEVSQTRGLLGVSAGRVAAHLCCSCASRGGCVSVSCAHWCVPPWVLALVLRLGPWSAERITPRRALPPTAPHSTPPPTCSQSHLPPPSPRQTCICVCMCARALCMYARMCSFE